MSKVSEQATVIVQIADFANIDQTGKGNILGVGGNIIPLGAAGMTPRFSVFAEIHIPAELCPCEVTVEYALRNDSNSVVSLPGPVPKPMRVASVLTIDAALNGLQLDQRNHIGAVKLNTLDFSNGLPLTPGNYYWEITLDGDNQRAVRRAFCVPKPAVPPVVG
ncbi:hypothetical protein BMYO_1678 [Bifidobacterium myosotis]|uniref:Uncharacterized protein n=1 Tax=Bifidobacterium myosotis TaxID=1630166 RepID=A0A261FGM7_9BIFI|nr:hypothetical protein [Bifidobacterium myosotis]OZG58155.1 hypothetical protein BMYO_1678 [Bifidobacterium myosotis]